MMEEIQMANVHFFSVIPKIPKEIKFLETLMNNIWWCWHNDAIALFRRIDPIAWRYSGHNPKEFFNSLPQEKIQSLVKDEGFMEQLRKVEAAFTKQVKDSTEAKKKACIAYFCLEFGLHESIRIYSGGLGILAGDHLKSSSDLDIPLVGVGLLYKEGYFIQKINKDGWQIENYPQNAIETLPITPVMVNGERLIIKYNYKDYKTLHCLVWELKVGNINLYLLDTDTDLNQGEDLRKITSSLYGGDSNKRIAQEIVLAIGGYKALLAMGYNPHACHLNEGHAAFLGYARIPTLMKEFNLDFDTALLLHSRTTLFTTHTPVPAGNEAFSPDLIRSHLQPLSEEFKLDPNVYIRLGQAPGQDMNSPMSMTILGLRNSHFANAVAKLHGDTSRKMWEHLWASTPVDEVPIGHITNGIHVPSWISTEMWELLNRYLGANWIERLQTDYEELFRFIDNIPNGEIWHVHSITKRSLIDRVRMRLTNQLAENRVSVPERAYAKTVLDPDALLIGFARRFATYKRATLILRDEQRLLKLLTNPDKPVQFVFAGKAHPADSTGKHFIQDLIKFAERNNVRDRFIFVENYNINFARQLVQGVDVWLNNPIRPEEASGTSGMKAAVNGVPNLSILDGWWEEGYAPGRGWAIETASADVTDLNLRNDIESQNLISLIETELTPLYYDRYGDDTPQKWVDMMKEMLKIGLKDFSTARMVNDYYKNYYTKAMENFKTFTAKNCDEAKKLLSYKQLFQQHFNDVSIRMPEMSSNFQNDMHVGDKVKVSVITHLGGIIKPEHVNVQLYLGKPAADQTYLVEGSAINMKFIEDLGNNDYKYETELSLKQIGRFGVTARVLPNCDGPHELLPGFIKWPTL